MPEGIDTDTLTLALVLTGAGTTIAAALIASVIEILKRLPGLGTLVSANAAAVSTGLALVLIVYAYLATTATPDAASAFAAFLAFVGVAGLAGKTYDVAKSIRAG
jgi:hypothetical protein